MPDGVVIVGVYFFDCIDKVVASHGKSHGSRVGAMGHIASVEDNPIAPNGLYLLVKK